LTPNPFFPNPLDDFKPKRPDFEPEIDPDYDDSLESDCPVCSNHTATHKIRDLIVCALELTGGQKN
jgi:hypothetical protein